MNGYLTSFGYIVYKHEASHSKINPYHPCGNIMQYNKHGILVCPMCRPPINKHTKNKPKII